MKKVLFLLSFLGLFLTSCEKDTDIIKIVENPTIYEISIIEITDWSPKGYFEDNYIYQSYQVSTLPENMKFGIQKKVEYFNKDGIVFTKYTTQIYNYKIIK